MHLQDVTQAPSNVRLCLVQQEFYFEEWEHKKTGGGGEIWKATSKTVGEIDHQVTDPASRPGLGGRPPRPSAHAWTWHDPEERTAAHHTGGSVGCPPQSAKRKAPNKWLKLVILVLAAVNRMSYLSVSWYGSILVNALVLGLNVSLCKERKR